MALTVQNTQSASWDTPNCVITKPTGLSVGDLMIGFIASQNTNNLIAAPTGWTLQISQSSAGSLGGGYVRGFLYYKIADAADILLTNFTWTSNGNLVTGCIYRITGHNPVTPIQSTNTDGSLTTTSTPSFAITVTPTNPSSILIFCLTDYRGGGGTTASGYAIATDNPSWTEVFDFNVGSTNGYQASSAYAIRTQTTATGNFSCILNTSCPELVGISCVIAPATTTRGNFLSIL